MSDYTKVVIETDSKGRMNISALDNNDAGHGYRLAGPKYSNDLMPGVNTAQPRIRVELDKRDVEEIRIYLRIFDEINGLTAQQARKEAERWQATADRLNAEAAS